MKKTQKKFLKLHSSQEKWHNLSSPLTYDLLPGADYQTAAMKGHHCRQKIGSMCSEEDGKLQYDKKKIKLEYLLTEAKDIQKFQSLIQQREARNDITYRSNQIVDPINIYNF